MWKRCAHHVVGANQIDTDVARPGGRISLRQCSDRLDHTGIVDQNIGLSEAPNRLTDRRLHRGVLRDIAGNTAGLPDLVVDGVGNLRCGLSIPRQDHHPCACVRQRRRSGHCLTLLDDRRAAGRDEAERTWRAAARQGPQLERAIGFEADVDQRTRDHCAAVAADALPPRRPPHRPGGGGPVLLGPPRPQLQQGRRLRFWDAPDRPGREFVYIARRAPADATGRHTTGP